MQRHFMGMSQEKLGEAIGLTFQQIQKYESGANRISAARLYALKKVLDVPYSFFFERVEELPQVKSQGGALRSPPPDAMQMEITQKRETLELVRAFNNIKDGNMRKRLSDLCRAMAAEASDDKKQKEKS